MILTHRPTKAYKGWIRRDSEGPAPFVSGNTVAKHEKRNNVVNVARNAVGKDTVGPTLLRFEGALCVFTISQHIPTPANIAEGRQ